MSFVDLNEWFDDTLRLPIGGTVYVVEPPNAALGVYCQRLLAAGATAAAGGTPDLATLLDDDAEIALYERIMGPAYAEMMADGVSWPKMQHAGATTFLWIAQNREVAENYWAGRKSGLPAGEAPAPANRAEKRATARKTAKPRVSTRTAGAPATPQRASTSGTKSRATLSASSAPTRARASRGSKS